MFTRWQLVLLGVVVFHGVGLSASEKSEKQTTPRLSCSQEARLANSGDLTAAALKHSLVRKEEKNHTVPMYYDSPCGSGRAVSYWVHPNHKISPMAPWAPDHYFPYH